MKKKNGFTLVELLAAMAISIIVIMIAGSLFLTSNYVNKKTNDSTKIQNQYRNFYDTIDGYFKYGNGITFEAQKMIIQNTGENVTGVLMIKNEGESTLIGYENVGDFIEVYEFNGATETISNANKTIYLTYTSKKEIGKNFYKFDVTQNGSLINFDLGIENDGIRKEYDFILNIDVNKSIYITVKNK